MATANGPACDIEIRLKVTVKMVNVLKFICFSDLILWKREQRTIQLFEWATKMPTLSCKDKSRTEFFFGGDANEEKTMQIYVTNTLTLLRAEKFFATIL